eukprot:scaffold22283_cov57-Phaeocystis_antarctica.AAC.4
MLAKSSKGKAQHTTQNPNPNPNPHPNPHPHPQPNPNPHPHPHPNPKPNQGCQAQGVQLPPLLIQGAGGGELRRRLAARCASTPFLTEPF